MNFIKKAETYISLDLLFVFVFEIRGSINNATYGCLGVGLLTFEPLISLFHLNPL
jgi:hypothetical protein